MFKRQNKIPPRPLLKQEVDVFNLIAHNFYDTFLSESACLENLMREKKTTTESIKDIRNGTSGQSFTEKQKAIIINQNLLDLSPQKDSEAFQAFKTKMLEISTKELSHKDIKILDTYLSEIQCEIDREKAELQHIQIALAEIAKFFDRTNFEQQNISEAQSAIPLSTLITTHEHMITICSKLRLGTNFSEGLLRKLNELANKFNEEYEPILVPYTHQNLEHAENAEIMGYFNRAIDATTSTENDRLPYQFKKIESIKTDILFIIDHLNALSDRIFNYVEYNRLIFGTCEKISAIENDDNAFVKEAYERLLKAPLEPGHVKFYLLKPFREYLGNCQHYTVDAQGNFFHYPADTEMNTIPEDQKLNWR